MGRTINFPEQQLDLQAVADECARRVFQPSAAAIREIAREAARRAPIKLDFESVSIPLCDAVDALKLEARVLDAIRAEIGEERFESARTSNVFGVIQDSISHAADPILDEAIEERVRVLSEQEGIPLPTGQNTCCC